MHKGFAYQHSNAHAATSFIERSFKLLLGQKPISFSRRPLGKWLSTFKMDIDELKLKIKKEIV